MKKIMLSAFVSLFALQAHASSQQLIDGVKENNLPLVIELLNNGEDVNGGTAQGNKALHYAVALDNAEMTKVLLSYGADLNASNEKGWTPLKIAEQKDLPNVTPVLVKYLQLQQIKQDMQEAAANTKEEAVNTVAAVSSATVEQIAKTADNVKEVPTEIIEVVEIGGVEEEVPAAIFDVVSEKLTNATDDVAEIAVELKEETVAPIKNVTQKVVEKTATVKETVAEKAPVKEIAAEVVNKVEEAQGNNTQLENYASLMEQAAGAIKEAREAQTKAQSEIKVLSDELLKVKEENAALTAKLAAQAKQQPKAEKVAAEAKKEVKATENKSAAKPAVEVKKPAKPQAKKELKKPASAKPAPQKAKPAAKKKPTHKPQPIVKKVVLTPSTLVNGIYAGDEEIVYCLDFLGSGENENLKKAAGYFAASAGINEPRYKEIVDMSFAFFNGASEQQLTVRDKECSAVITPKDKDKQNQIIRSMNKSVGY